MGGDVSVAVVAGETEVLAAVEDEGHPAGESDAEEEGAGVGEGSVAVVRGQDGVAVRTDAAAHRFLLFRLMLVHQMLALILVISLTH